MDNQYTFIPYNNQAAINYAHKWSHSRNPDFLDFSELGGDCTNFVSQCIFAGSGVMNFTPIYGWYYLNAYKRAASWTGAKFLYKFLTTNTSIGPYGKEIPLSEILPGDVIQLVKANGISYHSLIVVETSLPPTLDNILIATHTFDADYRPLSSYDFPLARFIHIEGVRKSS